MITGAREQTMIEAADVLLDARRTQIPIVDLPAGLQPKTLDEAYAIQDEMALAYGEIGGYKIGAPAADATPVFAPMPRAWMAGSGAVLSGPRYRFRGIEVEIAFLMGEDLPLRATPYTREEVLAAIASCHPAIEELESAYVDPRAVPRFHQFADLQMHGGFLHGPAFADWRKVDFATEKVTLTMDGAVRVERTGSNTSGDLLRLLPYLANEGAVRTGGLRAGQWITTGSWTGAELALPDAHVDAGFEHVGRVNLRFE
ncbi:MAG: fumarylacetoacetate hydrolase family protein [Acidobacteriaceae bacterium]